MALWVGDGVKVYEADADTLTLAAVSSSGVLSGCAVAAQGTPAMKVDVGAGVIAAGGAAVVVAAVTGLTVTAADPAQPRIDLVVADTTTGVATMVVGTPLSVPKPPALPTGKVLLSFVSVAAAAANIQNSNITNRRLPVGSMAPMLAGTLATRPSATGITGQTYFATDTAQLSRSTGSTWTVVSSGAGGVSLASDGTVGAPGFAFNAETSSGLYRIGAGDVALSILGVKVAEFTAGALAIGTTPATTGVIRLPNAGAIFARNAANSANESVIGFDGTNIITMGSALGSTVAASGSVTIAGVVAIGTTPATAGVIRIPNNADITARNTANTANISILKLATDDNVYAYDFTTLGYQRLRTALTDATGHLSATNRAWVQY